MEHLRAPSVTTGLFSIGWRLDGDLFPRPFVVISNFFSFFFLSFCCFPASMFADKGRAKRIDTCAFHRGMPNATVLFTQKENLIEIYIYIYIYWTHWRNPKKKNRLFGARRGKNSEYRTKRHRDIFPSFCFQRQSHSKFHCSKLPVEQPFHVTILLNCCFTALLFTVNRAQNRWNGRFHPIISIHYRTQLVIFNISITLNHWAMDSLTIFRITSLVFKSNQVQFNVLTLMHSSNRLL